MAAVSQLAAASKIEDFQLLGVFGDKVAGAFREKRAGTDIEVDQAGILANDGDEVISYTPAGDVKKFEVWHGTKEMSNVITKVAAVTKVDALEGGALWKWMNTSRRDLMVGWYSELAKVSTA